jgi:hypothetical protein
VAAAAAPTCRFRFPSRSRPGSGGGVPVALVGRPVALDGETAYVEPIAIPRRRRASSRRWSPRCRGSTQTGRVLRAQRRRGVRPRCETTPPALRSPPWRRDRRGRSDGRMTLPPRAGRTASHVAHGDLTGGTCSFETAGSAPSSTSAARGRRSRLRRRGCLEAADGRDARRLSRRALRRRRDLGARPRLDALTGADCASVLHDGDESGARPGSEAMARRAGRGVVGARAGCCRACAAAAARPS